MLKGYRTLIFQAIMSVGMLITVWTGHDTKDETTTVTQNLDGVIAALTVIWGIGNAWLRAITDTAIFKEE